MRVPEDYIMGTTSKKSSGVGCFFFILLGIIGIIVLICSVTYSAPSTPLGKWLFEAGNELKRDLIVCLILAVIFVVLYFIVRLIQKR